MRKRRILITAIAMAACSWPAAANPYIKPDPSIERGAAKQLAKEFGSLRGFVKPADIAVEPLISLDPVVTNAISRALPPGDWLKMQLEQSAAEPAEMAAPEPTVPIAAKVPTPSSESRSNRRVRIVYINNAPIF